MFFWMYLGLMPFALILSGVVWAMVALVRGLGVPRTVRGGAVCGVCAYAVDDTPGARCPECGHAYTTGGIRTRHSVARDRSSYFSLVGAWSLLSLLVVLVVSGVLSSIEHRRSIGNLQTTYNALVTYEPRSSDSATNQARAAPAYRVHLTADLTHDLGAMSPTPSGASTPLESGVITLTLERDGLAPVERTYEVDAGTAFEQIEIDAALAELGLDPEDPAIRYEADQLRLILAAWRDEPGLAHSGVNMIMMAGEAALNGADAPASTAPPAGAGLHSTNSSLNTGQNAPGSGRDAEAQRRWMIIVWGAYVLCALLWIAGLVIVIRRRMALKRLGSPGVPGDPTGTATA